MCPRLAFEEVVQFVADGGPADDGPADVRDQEGGGDKIVGQVPAVSVIIEHLQIGAPLHARLMPEPEGEILRRHDLKRAQERGLVAVSEAASAGASGLAAG